jgi:pimeloyl-ACP methyl ester carboxylesterase
MRALLALAASFPLALSCFAAAAVGMQKDVVFQTYSPLAADAELIDRLFRPMLAWRLREKLAATGQAATAQSVDLGRERFTLYVPDKVPASGQFGLLVWISPMDDAVIPPSWLPVLDRLGVICVVAAGSGNAANVFSRRMPLALLGYANVAKAYPIDQARTYIGGLSGGSRVALRIALGYPDVFRGVLLNAGSDVFGSAALALPKPELFRQFEEGTRLVYVTGSRDEEHLAADAHSRESARKLCIRNVDTEEMYGRAHELLPATALDRALTALSAPRKTDAEMGACRERRVREIEAQLNAVQTLIDAGNKRDAQSRLQDIDEQYGGLAAPRSVELERKL